MLQHARNLLKREQGITGLETAIILIAFVIVASVLAYVVLSAGLFSAQKAKEAVHAGLEEVKCTLEVKGNVLASMSGGRVTEVYFTLGNVAGGDAIDFTDTSGGNNRVVITFQDQYQHIPSVNWTMTKIAFSNTDNLLDDDELFLVTVALPASANVTPYHTFTLEVKPPTGAVLPLERTVPARQNAVINLY